MKNMMFLASAAAALAIPSAASAGTPYVGVEIGLAKGRGNDIDQTVDFTTVQTPATPAAPAGASDAFFDDVFDQEYKRGFEAGITAGYQFDLWRNLGFRLEGEFGYKRAGLRDVKSDDITDEFLSALNDGLNRPSVTPDPGAPGLPAVTGRDLELAGHLRLYTAMLNGQFNIAGPGGGSVFLGGGYGTAWSKAVGDSDKSRAWQYMIGYRHPISDKLDLGLKYRYFNSGVFKLVDDGVSFAGNPNRIAVPNGAGTTDVDQTTSAIVFPDIQGRYRSRSLSLALTYNFGR
jgi:opacity protein-like surface antigen